MNESREATVLRILEHHINIEIPGVIGNPYLRPSEFEEDGRPQPKVGDKIRVERQGDSGWFLCSGSASWVKERPLTPGWYYVRRGGESSIVYLVPETGTVLTVNGQETVDRYVNATWQAVRPADE